MDAPNPTATWSPALDVWLKSAEFLMLPGFEPSEEFSETWMPSGSMRSGMVYSRPTSAPPMAGSGSSFLPTPAAYDSTRGGVQSPAKRREGGASAFSRGRADAPVDRPLLRTPVADELGGGPLHPDVAKERGQTLRLSGQVLALTGHLLPTPTAGNPNDGEDIEGWLARRERVKSAANNGNGMGMPLSIAVRMLPTPQVADATGGHATRSGERSDELLLPGLAVAASKGALLPTPRASRGASQTETMYALGAERDDTDDRQGNVVGQVAWGEYEPAVRLWEALTRPAPVPTLPDGKNGNHRLAAVFPEWMMGYPYGWVTDIIGRNPAVKACGNGVVPQQAFTALGVLWERMLEWVEVAA